MLDAGQEGLEKQDHATFKVKTHDLQNKIANFLLSVWKILENKIIPLY